MDNMIKVGISALIIYYKSTCRGAYARALNSHLKSISNKKSVRFYKIKNSIFLSQNITFYLYWYSFSCWIVINRVLSVGFLNRTQTLDCSVFVLVSSTIKPGPNEFSSSDFLPTFSSSLMKKMFRNSANGSLKKKLATQKRSTFYHIF